MTTPQPDRMAALRKRADELTELAAHNERESIKLQGKRARRAAEIERSASTSAATRPSTSMKAVDITYAWSSNDPKLAEYSAGMVIVERRAAMYAAMAADVRAEIQTLVLLQLLAQSRRTT